MSMIYGLCLGALYGSYCVSSILGNKHIGDFEMGMIVVGGIMGGSLGVYLETYSS